jgi:hypothetical protein
MQGWREHPGVRWSVAAGAMLLLFFLPIINGVICGAIAAWPERERAANTSYALWAALVLFPLLWILSQYGVVTWAPFANLSGALRSGLSVLAMLATAIVVTAVRTTRSVI